jgi:fluoroquinolone transport system permease protein
MGLFFIGAIVLFEKSQHVLNSLAVSPIKTEEYILSKVISIAVISLIVGLTIGFACSAITNLFLFIVGLTLGSCFFTLLALLISSKSQSLNHFMIMVIPIEMLFIIPTVAYILGFNPSIFNLHPGVAVIKLLSGSVPLLEAVAMILLLCVWIIPSFIITIKVVSQMFVSGGGINL